jgi:hypothetical protein
MLRKAQLQWYHQKFRAAAEPLGHIATRQAQVLRQSLNSTTRFHGFGPQPLFAKGLFLGMPLSGVGAATFHHWVSQTHVSPPCKGYHIAEFVALEKSSVIRCPHLVFLFYASYQSCLCGRRNIFVISSVSIQFCCTCKYLYISYYIYLLFYLLTCLPICQPHLPRHPFFAHLHIYVYTGLQARNGVPMCASTLLCRIYTPKAACPLPAASAPPKVQPTAAGRLENISRWQRLDGLPHLPQLMSAICRSKTMGATSFKSGQI